MNTRRAAPGSPFRQERWASTRTQPPGLSAYLVAKRLGPDPAEEDWGMVWWIQERSWKPGGLKALAVEILDRLPPGTVCASQGRTAARDPRLAEFLEEDGLEHSLAAPAASIEEVELALAQFCLDPQGPPLGAIHSTAAEIRDAESVAERSGVAVTDAVRHIWPALSRAASQRSVVLIEGPARVGKTVAARAWCAASKGIGRLVQTPHGNDLDPLFRAIARALGTASATSYKTRQVEERVLKALTGSGLCLVFDDAWNLWPQGDIRQSHPRRLQWLLGLLDSGIGVGLVTAPQWWDCRRAFVAQTGWAVDQLDGRLASIVSLPPKLSVDDAVAVARATFPQVSPAVLEVLGEFAATSPRRLGALDSVFKEAVYNARVAGRDTPAAEDFKAAAQVAFQTESRLADETTGRTRTRSPGPRSGTMGDAVGADGDSVLAREGGVEGRRALSADAPPRHRAPAAAPPPAVGGGRLGIIAGDRGLAGMEEGDGLRISAPEGCLE